MGSERSVRAVGRKTGKDRALIEKWSSRWGWVARAAAWDAENDRVRREATLKAVAEMAERHAKLAVGLQVKVAARLSKLEPEELTAREVATWLDLAVKVERLARGEPTEIAAREISGPHGRPLVPSVERAREIVTRLAALGSQPDHRDIALSGGNGNGNGVAGH
jgi:hypothetical protein